MYGRKDNNMADWFSSDCRLFLTKYFLPGGGGWWRLWYGFPHHEVLMWLSEAHSVVRGRQNFEWCGKNVELNKLMCNNQFWMIYWRRALICIPHNANNPFRTTIPLGAYMYFQWTKLGWFSFYQRWLRNWGIMTELLHKSLFTMNFWAMPFFLKGKW